MKMNAASQQSGYRGTNKNYFDMGFKNQNNYNSR
jgi:hypothetical protein